jgi:signal transduction histidine kinase
MEEFSETVSHDLRASLRAMQLFCQALLDDYASRLDEVGINYLERIREASLRLERLVNDLLTLARSRESFSPLLLTHIDAEALIRQYIAQNPNLQKPYARVALLGPIALVCAHEGLLLQCVANLLNNAAKFVAPGRRPDIRIWSELNGPNVRLWFKDNGIGIPSGQKHRLFRKFQRVHRQDAYEGTGLGLSIVRKAAERMGGSVGVESTLGKGSSFWIELRRA